MAAKSSTCPECGYDMSGLIPDGQGRRVCPECGHQTPELSRCSYSFLGMDFHDSTSMKICKGFILLNVAAVVMLLLACLGDWIGDNLIKSNSLNRPRFDIVSAATWAFALIAAPTFLQLAIRRRRAAILKFVVAILNISGLLIALVIVVTVWPFRIVFR